METNRHQDASFVAIITSSQKRKGPWCALRGPVTTSCNHLAAVTATQCRQVLEHPLLACCPRTFQRMTEKKRENEYMEMMNIDGEACECLETISNENHQFKSAEVVRRVFREFCKTK